MFGLMLSWRYLCVCLIHVVHSHISLMSYLSRPSTLQSLSSLSRSLCRKRMLCTQVPHSATAGLLEWMHDQFVPKNRMGIVHWVPSTLMRLCWQLCAKIEILKTTSGKESWQSFEHRGFGFRVCFWYRNPHVLPFWLGLVSDFFVSPITVVFRLKIIIMGVQ